MNDPAMPSEEEKRDHEMTHLPYRSWCRHCIRGRGKEMGHRKSKEEPEGVEIHMDLCFPGGEEGPDKMTVLVARERRTRMTLATALPSKSSGTFVAKRVVAFMREIGCEQGDVTIKSDQEPAMKAIISEIGRVRAAAGGGRMMVESSPVGQSQSNGVVERAIGSAVAQMRVLKDALEGKLGGSIEVKHPVMAWIAEYAALTLNRFEVSADGKTAYERSKSKKAKTMGLEFGEAVMWKKKQSGGRLGKISSTWDDGIYLGVKGGTGEIIIGTTEGVWKTRTVQRCPYQQRWRAKNLEMVGGVPWRTSGNDPNADGEAMDPKPIGVNDGEALQEDEREILREVVKMNVPRTFRTTDEDYQTHGYSRGCPGCRALLRGGTARQKHSEQCRKRITEALAGDRRVADANERKRKFIDEALETEEKNLQQGAKKREVDESADGIPGLVDESDDEEMVPKREKRVMVDDENEVDFKRKRAEESTSSGDVTSVNDDVTMQVNGLDVNQEMEFQADEWAVDDISGKALDTRAVVDARDEELSYMEDLGVFERSTEEECVRMTGKMPTTTRWVDTDKGMDDQVLVRSRLVARDFKNKGESGRFDLYAAMPPIEAKRMIFRMAVEMNGREPAKKYKLMFLDVKKAHLNGKLQDDEFAYVYLPGEAGGGVARLRRWLYGMRPAAKAWEEDYAGNLRADGFVRGRAAPTVFHKKEANVSLAVHGDDFIALGPIKELIKFEERMKSWYDVKTRGILGPEAKDDREIRILNRRVKWEGNVITYEADERNVETIVNELGLQKESRGLDVTMVQEESVEGDDEALEPEEAWRFKRIVALANYVSLDRPDLQAAVSNLCSDMVSPTKRSWSRLKRIGRYLVNHPRMVFEYREYQRGGDMEITVFSDSDWAGCRATRKSRSGGIILLAGGVVKTWSNKQGSRALSSGEAEYYDLVKASAEAMGVQSVAKDLGWDAKIKIYVDSTASKAIASRLGIGKIRHLEVRYLWVQDEVARKRIQLRKVLGKDNPADVLTKALGFPEVARLLQFVHTRFV